MIKVTNLVFKYAESPVYAIDNITCNIPQGKYVAILGHNGSGKSTFSKLLVGLYKGNSGKIEIDGLEMNKSNLIKIRSKIGIVFQNPDNQFVGATVEDDIAFGLENKNLKREQMKPIIMNLVTKVGMEKYLEREPQNLSGGQKQRVAIASTLALNPEIIIFDEVTSMLDPRGKTEILNLIKQIQKEKEKTLISITHDMDEAILADEVIVLSNGKIVAQGKPQDVLSNEKIIKIARIDNPFIYKLSAEIFKENKLKATFSEEQLLEEICK